VSVANLITREGVILKVANDNAGTPGTYSTFARVAGQINVSDSRNAIPISDFDTLFDQIVEQVRDGRTVSISWTSNLVIDDAGFLLARAAYEADTDLWLKIELTSRGGSASEDVEYFGGFTDFSVTYNESGVAQGNFTFAASSFVRAS
jgi:hypothetical protein